VEALVSNQLSRNTGNTEHVADSSFSDASSNLAVQEILQASIKPEYSQTCSLKPASKVHVILSHSLRYILILSSHVRIGFQRSLPFRFNDYNVLYISDFWHASYMPVRDLHVRIVYINHLTPNDPYRGSTAPLISKRCILYIY